MTPFGSYLLDELIAEGGMARVYRARLRGVGGFEKPLVVKQVRPELARDPRFVEMFVQEANTLVRLSHPHIVPVYELGVVDGIYFLAMELVDGATLSAILKDGPLPPPLVARLASQIAGALQHAHERFGLVHRDVTPRNVLVDEAGHVRLVDFGIATPAEGDGGEVFGSPGYMSPEQLRGEPLGPASDLFSLGAVLWQCLVGEAAFLREGAAGARAAVLEREAPPLPETVPAPLRELVMALLAREPAARPASAAEVGRRMRTWLASEKPEGVADELGARAAEAAARLAAPGGPVTVTSKKDPGQEVQTLATASVLSRAREVEPEEGTAPVEAAAKEPRADGADGEAEPGTVRLPGRGGARDEEPGTVRLAGRGAAREEPPASDAPVGSGAGRADAADAELDGEERGAAGESPAPMGEAPASGSRSSEETPEAIGNRDTGRDTERRGAAVAAAPREAPSALRRGLPLLLALAAGAALAWVLVRPPAPSPGRAEPGAGETEAPAGEEPPPALARPSGPIGAGADEGGEAAEAPPTRVEEERPATMEASAMDRPSGMRAVAPGGRAHVTVSATPWASARLDGRALGNTPIRREAASAGEHVLVLENPPLGRRVEVRFDAAPGQAIRVFADLSVDPPVTRVR
ncbi:MAG TPA: protein kinase [Polyangiaceae bacterium LLY-WYZ-15_(1-7)]|nr:protein kinase [Polyangiaceae bacterium LLY-WYZ-15_(1-7)]HJL34234.1 protein kinase [Polyangiaceae bacterium LLY-WYZ-15_(1-7)]